MIAPSLALAAVALCFASGSDAADRKGRVFTAPIDAVWNAAVNVAGESFLTDRISREARTFRLRAGPLRAYRFDVVLTDLGGGKTRVDLELRTSMRHQAVERDAWRTGERFLMLIAQRLDRRGKPSAKQAVNWSPASRELPLRHRSYRRRDLRGLDRMALRARW